MYLQHWDFLINCQVFLSIHNVLFYVRNPAFRLNCIQTEISCPQRWSIRILMWSRILTRSYLWSIWGQIVSLTPLLYKTDRFYFAMHLFRIHHRWCQNMVRTPVTHLVTASCATFFVLTTFWCHLWSVTQKNRGKNGICLVSTVYTKHPYKKLMSYTDSPYPYLLHHRYTLDEYGTARRTAVVRCFIDALTRGGMYVQPWRWLSDQSSISLQSYLHVIYRF